MPRKSFRYSIVLSVCLLLLAGSWTALGQTGDAFQLPSMLVPEVGSVASYVITETMSQTVAQRTGFFLLVSPEEMEVFNELSAGVRYTVLEWSGDGKEVLLGVEIQGLERETGEPISGSYWNATYLLSADEERSGWRDGAPNMLYGALVEPVWLSDWLLTPEDDRPSGDMVPGFRWQATGEIPGFADELGMEDANFNLVGTFVGWEQLSADYGRAARVVEVFTGSGEMEDEIEEGMPAKINFDLRGASRYAIIPGAFPYGADLELTGRMAMDMNMGIVGMSGGVTMAVAMNKSIVRDDAGPETWFVDVPAMDAVQVGQILHGVLEEPSDASSEESAVATHTFYGEEGQTVVIRARSQAFDTHLALLDPAGELLAWNDDGWNTSDSMIVQTLPTTGLYTVLVESYWADEAGEYTLSIEPAPGADILQALELIGVLRNPEGLTDDDLDAVEDALWLLMDFVYEYES